jgi:dihydrofolate synthase / folylpolyglutamate synthase
MEQLSKTPYTKLHVVFGMVADKDIASILKRLPKQATYYFCKPDLPRGLDAGALRLEAARHKLTGKTYASVTKALKAAQDAAGKDDLVYVGGSTFVVGEVI